MTGSWADLADRVLSQLFVVGKPAPTYAQVRDAYPFGPRKHWPYKAWLRRMHAWRHAHKLGLSTPVARVVRSRAAPRRPDPRQTDLLDEVAGR